MCFYCGAGGTPLLHHIECTIKHTEHSPGRLWTIKQAPPSCCMHNITLPRCCMHLELSACRDVSLSLSFGPRAPAWLQQRFCALSAWKFDTTRLVKRVAFGFPARRPPARQIELETLAIYLARVTLCSRVQISPGL